MPTKLSRAGAVDSPCSRLFLEASRPIRFLEPHIIPLASCYVQATPLPKDSPLCSCAPQSGLLRGGGCPGLALRSPKTGLEVCGSGSLELQALVLSLRSYVALATPAPSLVLSLCICTKGGLDSNHHHQC